MKVFIHEWFFFNESQFCFWRDDFILIDIRILMIFWARKYSEKNSKREGFRVYPSIYIIWQGSDFELSFFVHMHAEHQCSTLVTWSNLKEWCRATHKPPKTMKRLTTYGDVKIWAWFCLVLLAVLLMTLERQHKSCVRGSPHFILGHYDKSVAHCKNDALSLLVPDEMWPLLLLWLWYLTNNNPTLILQKFAGWTHYNSQLTILLK